ncbi:MAG: universal stress protein [Gemmataceae bacterium]
MKRDHRINRIRHHDRLTRAAAGHCTVSGSDSSLLSSNRHDSKLEDGVCAEALDVGLRAGTPSRFRSIVVPLDGEQFAEHALPHALAIARRAGAEIQLVHVHSPLQSAYQPHRLYYDSGLDGFLLRTQQKYLDDMGRRLRKVSPVPVTPVFLQGREIADSLCEAVSTGTDLIVMATHGRGPLGRFWFGGIADVLMRRLSVPLLFVRGHQAPVDLTGDPLVRQVLIPLDGSAVAEQILEPALTLGTLRNAEHTLLRVIPLVVDYSFGYYSSGLQRSLADTRQAEAWSYLRQVVAPLRDRKLRVRPDLAIAEGPAARTILHYSQKHDVDLIALATRGLGGLTRLFNGSVADQVIRGASVPVLVYRPKAEGGER